MNRILQRGMVSDYRNLAPYYSSLFPVGSELKAFLEPHVRKCSEGRRPWLDIGCGTGALVGWLLERNVDAWGLDPDRDFVREANRRSGCQGYRIFEGGMLDRGDLPNMGGFATVTCLGNVLAHASGLGEISAFFRNAAADLREGGRGIVQTVNFDKVLRSGDWQFPILERTTPDGRNLRFERRYHFEGKREGEPIRFDTALCVGDDRIENSTRLFPVQKASLLKAAAPFFKDVCVFGDFSRSAWNYDSPATVLVGAR